MTTRKKSASKKVNNCPRGIDRKDSDMKMDWELTGEEEMKDLLSTCRKSVNKIDIRDRLNNLKDLIWLCHDCLSNSQLIEIRSIVSSVLYFHVLSELKITEEELSRI